MRLEADRSEPGGNRLPGKGCKVTEGAEAKPTERVHEVPIGEDGEVLGSEEHPVVSHHHRIDPGGVGCRHPGSERGGGDPDPSVGLESPIKFLGKQFHEVRLTAVEPDRALDGNEHEARLDDLHPGDELLDQFDDTLEPSGLIGTVSFEDHPSGAERLRCTTGHATFDAARLGKGVRRCDDPSLMDDDRLIPRSVGPSERPTRPPRAQRPSHRLPLR